MNGDEGHLTPSLGLREPVSIKSNRETKSTNSEKARYKLKCYFNSITKVYILSNNLMSAFKILFKIVY